MKKQLPGFALLEAAMALMILGIIASFTFPMITSLMTYERTKRTADHREQILRALAGYFVLHKELPWPDKPDVESKLTRACQGPECKGIVPYKKLGLPKNVAKDGHGHWYTYAVHSTMTGISGNLTLSERIERPNNESLFLKDLVTDQDPHRDNNSIFIILISHGSSGGGAYHEDTQEKYPTDNQYEQINAADDLNFVTGDAKNFFHQVSWVSKIHFFAHYMQNPMTLKQEDKVNNTPPKSDNHSGNSPDQLSAVNNAGNVERINNNVASTNNNNILPINNNIGGNPKTDRETKMDISKKLKRDFIRKPNQQNNISSNQPGNK